MNSNQSGQEDTIERRIEKLWPEVTALSHHLYLFKFTRDEIMIKNPLVKRHVRSAHLSYSL